MDNLTKKQLEDLLLTKAMTDYATKEKRFDCLNDVIDEVFADGALDREEYLHSIMELTQLGYISSDLACEEDIEMSEAVGYDIIGLTPNGIEYINRMMNDETIGSKVKGFFAKFDECCGKVANSGFVKLTSAVILPALALLR